MRNTALLLGANDFLVKPLDRHEVLLRARNLLHTRHLFLEAMVPKRFPDTEVGQGECELEAGLIGLFEGERLAGQLLQAGRHPAKALIQLGYPAAFVACALQRGPGALIELGNFFDEPPKTISRRVQAGEQLLAVLWARRLERHPDQVAAGPDE